MDDASPIPINRRIKEHILGMIQRGELKAGDRVASEMELARAFGASRMTVNRAVKELTLEGRLERVQGLGTFVLEPKPLTPLFEIRSIDRDIEERGEVHSARVIELTRKPAPDTEAKRLGVPSGTDICRLSVVHMADGTPLQLEDRLMNARFVPDFMEQDFEKTTATEYLLNNVTYTEVEHRVDAIRPTARMAELLRISREEPCLRLVRRTWDAERPVTCVEFVYPGKSFRLSGRFSAPSMQGSVQ